MLNLEPSNLLDEIRAAERARKPVLQRSERAWHLYMGAEAKGETTGRSIENLPFELINLLLPNIVFNNPKVAVDTRLPHTERQVAESQRYVLDRWVSDMELADQLETVAYEFLFSYGVVMTTIASQPGYDDRREFVPQRPFVQHIRSDTFFVDPKAYSLSKARYMGHSMLIDKNDLEKDQRVNSQAIQDAAEKSRVSDEFTPNRREMDAPDRKQVKVYEVWVPEKTLGIDELPKNWRGGPPLRRNGYNGTIYTLVDGSNDQKKMWLRDPRPFYGPPWGPYTVFGAYFTKKWPLPLSALSAVIDQAEDFNDLAVVNSNASKNYKRFAVAATDDKAKKLAEIEHGHVASIPGFDKDISGQFEIGGVTNQMQAQEQMAEARLDRNIGLGGAVKTPQKGVTATAETIAEEKTDVRLSWQESRFMKGVQQVIKTASWYFHYTPEMVFGIGDPKTGMQGTFIGGEDIDEIVAVAGLVSTDLLAEVQESIENGMLQPPPRGSWYNLEIEVDMYSTRRTDEALEQRRALQTLQVLIQLAPVIAQTPYMTWDEILDWVGERLNQRSLGSLIDLDVLQQFVQIQLAQGVTKSDARQGAFQNAIPRDPTRIAGLQNSGELAASQRLLAS